MLLLSAGRSTSHRLSGRVLLNKASSREQVIRPRRRCISDAKSTTSTAVVTSVAEGVPKGKSWETVFQEVAKYGGIAGAFLAVGASPLLVLVLTHSIGEMGAKIEASSGETNLKIEKLWGETNMNIVKLRHELRDEIRITNTNVESLKTNIESLNTNVNTQGGRLFYGIMTSTLVVVVSLGITVGSFVWPMPKKE